MVFIEESYETLFSHLAPTFLGLNRIYAARIISFEDHPHSFIGETCCLAYFFYFLSFRLRLSATFLISYTVSGLALR